ncbi:MAG: hypothetical protein ACRD12_24250, partial [Acidimicrobiales bacterium]
MRTGIALRLGATTGVGSGGGVSFRTVTAGARLRMLVLAAEPKGCVGVDMETGAFVRASHPVADELASPFEVVAAEMLGTIEPPDAARPEALELVDVPTRVGRLAPKKAQRLLAPLHHPPRLPLLGFHANAVPYWTLTG